MCDFIQQALISKDALQKVCDNREHNKLICQYYDRFATWDSSVAFDRVSLDKKLLRVINCNKSWWVNYYPINKVKDFQKTFLCMDKFCSNCKKVRQAGRMAKYIPQVEPYADMLYHLVLTVPSCFGVDLRNVIRHMAKCFKSLINFITCHDKIKGIDFSGLGYQGAIRSLEVTFKKNKYHPHYHIAFAFDNLTYNDKERNIINDFSYSYGKLVRLYHPLEILIQKIWRLLIDGIKVTKSNIDNLDRGYSCTVDKFKEGDYAELFKYMTKECDEDGDALTYDNFISLYYGLFRVKQIQGYGIFYNIVDEGLDLDSLQEIYASFIFDLDKNESPQALYESVEDLKNDNDNLIISRKSYFKYLNQALQDNDTNNNTHFQEDN